MKRFSAFVLLIVLMGGVAPASHTAAAQKKSKKEIYESQCLLYGTVFTNTSYALPDADVKVRRTSERKPKWDALSDRRGEFAIRVPGGADYEITVKAKGYAPMSKTVNAPAGSRQDLVFRLEPEAGGKKP